jgi:hypothetical protein
MRHMDCCAENGCFDGSCGRTLAEAKDRRGNDLVKHLEGKVRTANKARQDGEG